MSSDIKTVGQLAQAVHDHLDADNWCKGKLTADGKVCLLGATNVVAYGSAAPWPDPDDRGDQISEADFVNPATLALARGMSAVGLLDPLEDWRPAIGIIDKAWLWNDVVERSIGEVRDGLLRVAAACADTPCDLTPPEGFGPNYPMEQLL